MKSFRNSQTQNEANCLTISHTNLHLGDSDDLFYASLGTQMVGAIEIWFVVTEHRL